MACRYAGIDWATEKHDVLIAGDDGSEVLTGTFAHDEKGLGALCRMLVRLEVRLVAIERPDGLLVERLLDAGLRVLAPAFEQGRRRQGSVPRLGREVRSV
jgi:transposase